MRRRSTARARRLISTLRKVPIAVRRNTGATARWMVREMSKMWESTAIALGPRGLACPAGLHEREDKRQQTDHHDAANDRGEIAADQPDIAEARPDGVN